MLRVGILGASGYTGSRLAYYLSRHREVEIAFLTSRQEKGKPFSSLYGFLKNVCDIRFTDPEEVKDEKIDVIFTCAPDQTSMKIVPEWYEKGVRIIDLAGDFRMDTADAYEKWYGAPHTSVNYLEKAVYGLTELNRERIKNSRLVSNPGCYPTTAILGLAPVLKEGLIDRESIHVNSVSGISGAGRDLKMFKQFYEADSNVMPYKLGRSHKHVGEIEQELSRIAGNPCRVTFAPHVVPMKTGIVSTILVNFLRKVTRDEIAELYSSYYSGEFFVRFRSSGLPESKFVADTNFCDIGFDLVGGTDKGIIVSAICNLGKGASGQAVQNMNVMSGFDEKEGLL